LDQEERDQAGPHQAVATSGDGMPTNEIVL
jgi:hypothetical protein